MKNIFGFLVLLLIIMQNSFAQTTPKGNFEFGILGTEFVERASFGASLGVNTNWHERFRSGLNIQVAGNRNSNDFGYGVNNTFYTAFGITFTNSAELFSVGRFSLEANANIGALIISLEDRDEPQFDGEYISVADEFFRFFQGGLTASFLVRKKPKTNTYIYTSVLKNQAVGNVRFGGESGNSNFQFAIGIRYSFF